jgi:hypothetical protein
MECSLRIKKEGGQKLKHKTAYTKQGFGGRKTNKAQPTSSRYLTFKQ